MRPVLFIFSGLPASGKSTLAKLLAKEYNAAYLRIDTIEQALRDLCNFPVQGEGYRLAYRIAGDNLNAGNSVVADSCNPIPLTRREWEEVGTQAGSRCIDIEVVCSDQAKHKRRCETRTSEITGMKLPTWAEIQNREYARWESSRICIDTANQSIEESFSTLKQEIETQLKSISR